MFNTAKTYMILIVPCLLHAVKVHSGKETFTFRADLQSYFCNHNIAGAVCILHSYFSCVSSYPVRKAGGETINSNTTKWKYKECLNLVAFLFPQKAMIK